MGRSKAVLPQKKKRDEAILLGRQSLPKDISIDAMMMIEVEQARIAQQHRTAMASNRTTPADNEAPARKQQRQRRRKRKKKTVSFSTSNIIIGPPELQMIQEENLWKIHPLEQQHEKLHFIRTIPCPNIRIIPQPLSSYPLTSPQSSVDALSQAIPAMQEDQRRCLYHAVQKRHVIVCLERRDEVVYLSVALTDVGWEMIQSREMSSHHPTPYLQSLLLSLFPGLIQYANSSERVMTAEQFYKLVDNQQLLNGVKRASDTQQIPGLKPTLRPYQRAAVDWMVRREQDNTVSEEWKLAWVALDRQTGKVHSLCRHSSHTDRDILYHCPFSGWFADSLSIAREMTAPNMQPIKGGILAESMGLGKTVEVLACILSNPCPRVSSCEGFTKDEVSNNATESHACAMRAKVGNSLGEFDDELSLSDDIRPRTGQQQAIPVVTPDRTVKKLECWSDDDTLGSCLCGELICFSRPRRRVDVVVCRACKEPMHYECAYIGDNEVPKLEKVNFRQRFTNATIGGYYCSPEVCPSCQPAKHTKATLIVSPIAILNQWEREIQRHTELTSNKPLKVIVYTGIKHSSGDRSQSKLMHPRYLDTADVVLASFEALRTDLGHVEDSSENQLRRRKRYRIVRSPLVALIWWRVCLDEAQRVESTATGAARVALALKAINRWCVSGTPIGRGRLNDLYGLLLFLGVKPFDNSLWFRRCIQRLSTDSDERVVHLLKHLFWRSTKELTTVRAQMNVPEQTENRVILKLSSVEMHFYNKQLERTLQIAGSLRERSGKRRKTEAKLVSNQLHMLRAACCHPQVGSRGIASIRKHGVSDKCGVDSRVMTMGQILDKLIVDAKLQCEEAQRLTIMHTNAMAAISRLKVEARNRGITSTDTDESLLEKSCKHYMESISLAEENSAPTLVVGEINIQGSVGFVNSGRSIQRGSTTLEWKSIDDTTTELWVDINFASEQRSISEIRLRQIPAESEAMLRETSPDFKWQSRRLEKIDLQCAGQNGEFSIVETLIVSDSEVTLPVDDWIAVKGFRTKKSKTWRVSIKVEDSSKQDAFISTADGSFLRLEVELFEASIANDPLQRLHCLHNASISFTALSNLHGDQDSNSPRQDDLKGKSLQMSTETSFIEKHYMDKARGVHNNAKFRFQLLSGQRQETEAKLHAETKERKPKVTDCWESTWWEHFLISCNLQGSEKTTRSAYERLVQDLDGFIQGEIGTFVNDGLVPFPAFANLNGFLVAMRMRLQSIRTGLGERIIRQSGADAEISTANSGRFLCPVGAHASCMRKMLNISDNPTKSEIAENSSCMVCKADWNQTGPMCRHCKIGVDLEDLVPDRVTVQALRSIFGLLRGPLGRTVLSQSERERLLQQAKCFFDVLDMMNKERTAAQRFWRVHLDFMNDLDELRQCKTAMRLTFENENLAELSEDEQNGVVAPCDLHIKYSDHSAKQAMALGNLKRCKGTLNYLKSLVNSESEDTREQATCMICLAPFDGDRAVLRCGHSVHVDDCLERLRVRFSNGRNIACPLRCRIRTEPADILVASNESHNDGTRSDEDVKGSYGTKVTRLVSDIKKMRQLNEKGVVFSQWDDMIEIISSALKENDIPFVLAAGASKIGRQVDQFRSSDCSVLLLNVKNGGEGLTLLEANHVFMVEPLLNTGLDRQAINRVHRIGQKRKTYVWRYIVADTIETKVDALRTGETNPTTVGSSSSRINAGGIDGFFPTETEILDLLQH